jgi:hypothetical protein
MCAFLAEIGPARNRLFRTHPSLDPVDVADGEAYLAQLMDGALQFLQADPAEPAFVPWVTPTRRWNDNARDSEYWMAPVDGSHTYRITGRRGQERYLSFTVYAGDPGHPETAALNLNHVDLGVAPGRDFEFAIEPPADACYVISRQYLCDPERERPGTFRIRVTGGPQPAPPDDAALAARWHQAQRFVHAMTVPRAVGAGRRPSYVSTTTNLMGDPSAWRHDEGGGRGTPDQTYASGPYALAEDEALVMEVRFPPAAYAGAALWNRFSQTVDRRFHRSTINASEAVCGPDGTTRIVVANRDPKSPNWLDTGGRRRGFVFWRFLLAEDVPPPVVCRVVPVDEVPE